MYKANDARLVPFPKDQLHPDKKTAKWHYDYAVAMYSHILNSRTELQYNNLEELKENRLYGAGDQDYRQYMKMLLDLEDNELLRQEFGNDMIAKGYMNVNFKDIVSVLPKFKSIIIGIFTSLEHEVDCYSYNEMATDAREDLKWDLWVKTQYQDLFNQVKDFIKAQKDEQYIPASVRELELFEQLGGLKLKEEIAMEMVISECDKASDWTAIEEQILSDMFDLNMMCIRDYVDPVTGMVRKRRVDPINSGVIKSSDGKVIKGAELRMMSIAEIRQRGIIYIDNNDSVSNLTPEEIESKLMAVSRSYDSMFGNSHADYSLIHNPDEHPYGYDHIVVPVLECEFVTTDRRVKSKRNLPGGGTGMFTERKKEINSSNEKYVYEDVQVVRTVNWIVGTKMICSDFGLMHNIPRPKLSEANTSFHFVKLPGKSLARRCKRPADDIQLANLRIQNGIAIAVPDGFAYEYSTLKVPTKDGKDLDFLDIIKMHTQTGRYVFSAKSPRGAPITSGQPVFPLAGGMGKILEESMKIIEKSILEIQTYTGLNEFVDGSNPTPRVGLGVGEMAQVSANNSLRSVYNGLIRLRERSSANVALRVQVMSKASGGINAYADIIGMPAWKALQLGSSFDGMVQTVKYMALPTQQERMELEMALEKAMSVGKNGEPLITLSDYFAIKRLIKSKSSLKLAQVLLAERERIAAAQADERARANMEYNAQIEMQASQQKSAAEKELKLFESRLEALKETHKTDEMIRLYKELKKLGIQNVPGIPDIKTELANTPPAGTPAAEQVEQAANAPAGNMFTPASNVQ